MATRSFQINVIVPFAEKARGCGFKLLPPITPYSFSKAGKGFGCSCKLGALGGRWSSLDGGRRREEMFMGRDRNSKRAVLVRMSQGFNFNGGGGGNYNSNNVRILGNLALAIGLTYLSMTGQLGWVLDAIVSIWLIAVLLPIIGLGAFVWYMTRDMVQGRCPNCGNDFQVFKSFLKDGYQLCPFCSQPFSVQDNKFVGEPTKFSSNRATTFSQIFDTSSRGEKAKSSSSVTVVDIEAEVKDVD